MERVIDIKALTNTLLAHELYWQEVADKDVRAITALKNVATETLAPAALSRMLYWPGARPSSFNKRL